MTMIERVASALWHAYRESIPANAEIPTWDGPMMTDYARRSYRDLARAAIEAMREADVDPMRIILHAGTFTDAHELWSAVIDTALTPEA